MNESDIITENKELLLLLLQLLLLLLYRRAATAANSTGTGKMVLDQCVDAASSFVLTSSIALRKASISCGSSSSSSSCEAEQSGVSERNSMRGGVGRVRNA